MSQSSSVSIRWISWDKYQRENSCMHTLSHLTTTLPHPCTCYCADRVPRAQSRPYPQSQTIRCVLVWLLSLTVCFRIRATCLDLSCRICQCSWAIMFHKGQSVSSTIQARSKLEKLHLAFLWLTPASRWKWFPKVTGELGSKLLCTENIRLDGAEGQECLSCSHPWPWQGELASESGENHRQSECPSSPQCPSHHPTPSPAPIFWA